MKDEYRLCRHAHREMLDAKNYYVCKNERYCIEQLRMSPSVTICTKVLKLDRTEDKHWGDKR